MLEVRCHEDIKRYCEENNIKRADFNKPVIIPADVTSCRNMFYKCYSFNQNVIIPDGVRDCHAMFYECLSFNQPVIIPENVIDCRGMFYACLSFNQPIKIPKSVMQCDEMFVSCKSMKSRVICEEYHFNPNDPEHSLLLTYTWANGVATYNESSADSSGETDLF